MIKVGGGTLAGGALEDLPGIVGSGTEVALVHGGGAQLTRMLDALGAALRASHEGLRVTDAETLEVAEMVFAGSVNKALARELNAMGMPAAGISGTDGPTLLAEPVPELGRVGEVVRVETGLVEALWRGGFVPVVAPLGRGTGGRLQRQRRRRGGGARRGARGQAPPPAHRRGRVAQGRHARGFARAGRL